MNNVDLSTGAQSLVFDLADGCTAHRNSNGVPCIVMPKPGGPKLRTSGQIEDIFVKELLDRGLIHEADNGACALTPNGLAYCTEHPKKSN